MAHGTALEIESEPPAAQCRHHWLIETPKGATSWGICKLCREQRQFMNSAPEVLWDREGTSTSKDEFVASFDRRLASSGKGEEDF